MARHSFGAYGPTSKGKGHPIMFGAPKPCLHYEDFPDGGGYPKGFLEWCFDIMGVDDPSRVLHLCSGSMVTGIRVDIRESMNPTIVADCRNVPLPDSSVQWILADPPYSAEYARNLYDTEPHYPKPYEIIKESCRLLVPGGLVGLMHFQVPYFRKPMSLVGVWGITQGIGYGIRAWSLLKKEAENG